MKLRLNFIPPNGGAPEYSLDFEMPAVPQRGDYISIKRPITSATETPGTHDFIVRRTRWWLDHPDNDLSRNAGDDTRGSVTEIVVDCEFAFSHFSTEEHMKSVKGYAAKGKGPLKHL